MTLKVCIHGHFYQPPREDPWTGMLPNQPSAAPFHDWNQRIQDECYRPNCRAMILDEGGDVASRCNTYRHISFNFGPTLLHWMREHDSRSYEDILRADREAVEATGHGNAIAQAYHHAILPLASARDKQTEVAWGVADFKHRFGRDPVGMWLPECAIDIASLEVLADHGIRFTIIAPDQVQAIRPIEGGAWTEVDAGTVPTHQPYAVQLPSGRRIAVFVYHGGVSQGIAFGGLLHSGPEMAKALVKAGTHGGLVSIATDGESYGHHHRHGEMALAWVIDEFSRLPDVEMISYERHLALHPPTRELLIKSPSAWSCAHGVGRWNRNCGCAIDPAWSGKQGWRGPLRQALEDLRDQLDEDYVLTMHRRGLDPWAERNAYIQRLLKREDAGQYGPPLLTPGKEGEVARALEIQHCVLRMFTSCAWFFDDPAGLETTQVLRYAHKAVMLHDANRPNPVGPAFYRALGGILSARPEVRSAQDTWDRLSEPPKEPLPTEALKATIAELPAT